MSPKKLKALEEKYKVQDSEYQDAMRNKLYDESKIIQNNKEELAHNVEQEKMKSCTFQPKVLFLYSS